jgi:D-arabinose 5-phosphate isomerase GutQ/DNA-binding response OmpR family regulator
MDKILIALDDLKLQRFLRSRLHKFIDKIEIVLAGNREDAISALEQGHISLLVTDLQMSKGDGPALLSYLNDKHPDIPCIVLTDQATPEIKGRFSNDINHFIIKPFDLKELAETMIAGLYRSGEGYSLTEIMDRVLIVDDDELFLDIIKQGMQNYKSQFQVLTASDGDEAIEVLKREYISVLVTDLVMPKLDGLELLAHMTRSHPATPCIVMTGYGSPAIKKRADRGEILSYIEKPFDSNKLAGAIIKGLDLSYEGDYLTGISVSSFLQIINMEKKTCFFEISSMDKRKGLFYFKEGIPYDALCDDLEGEDAAIEMISWDYVEFRFKSLPKEDVKQRINENLTSLIMEGAKIKDELKAAEKEPGPVQVTQTEKIIEQKQVSSSKKQAVEFLKKEAEGILKLADRIDDSFGEMVDLIYNSRGRLVISGIGKSGIVGQEIVATLNNTGIKSQFLHPAEVMHGDIGMIGSEDIFLALSNSGETDELKTLLPSIRWIGCTIITFTGNKISTLAKQSNIVIDVGVEREASPLDLAPNARTTALHVMGDALAVALINKKDNKVKDPSSPDN